MGNSSCACTNREYIPQSLSKLSKILSFQEEAIRVDNYTKDFESIKSLSDLENKSLSFVPHKVYCLKSTRFNSKHYTVKLKCSSIVTDSSIIIEISYRSLGMFKIRIFPSFNINNPGKIKYKHKFPLEYKQNKILKGLFFWMNSIKDNPNKGLRGDSNMGRIIYLHLKNQKFADTTCDRVFYDELKDYERYYSEKDENYYSDEDLDEENDELRYKDDISERNKNLGRSDKKLNEGYAQDS
ncbi:hypothetical protein SteCoe_21253 [Stentor coeruleus]|uniref:Uncharacterized protein n=1 Tax=Stentor coeruleus TaxID=5963 RepID=A0A1R2BPY0_9CILI|nr:hypothetical protein SteCoe_21253 [Stentor coeruleus]